MCISHPFIIPCLLSQRRPVYCRWEKESFITSSYRCLFSKSLFKGRPPCSAGFMTSAHHYRAFDCTVHRLLYRAVSHLMILGMVDCKITSFIIFSQSLSEVCTRKCAWASVVNVMCRITTATYSLWLDHLMYLRDVLIEFFGPDPRPLKGNNTLKFCCNLVS